MHHLPSLPLSCNSGSNVEVDGRLSDGSNAVSAGRFVKESNATATIKRSIVVYWNKNVVKTENQRFY